MIVCHCNVVRARTIERAIRRGASTVEQLQADCGAGTRCGGCHNSLCEMLAEASTARSRFESVVSVSVVGPIAV